MSIDPDDKNAFDTYRRRREVFQQALARLTISGGRLTRIRLATVLAFGAAAAVCGYFDTIRGVLGSLIVGAGVWILLVFRHHRNAAAAERVKRLVEINDTAGARLDGRWRAFADGGNEFIDAAHPYSSDLDIFGQGSLFQWLNATGTYPGRRKLAEVLSNRHFDRKGALIHREAIRTLAPLLDWRQDFQTAALGSNIYKRNPQAIIDWMENDAFLFRSPVTRWLLHFLPFAFLAAGILFYAVFGLYHLFLPWIPVNLIILLLRYRSAGNILSQFDHHEKTLSIYAVLLRHIEQCPDRSPGLQEYIQRLAGGGSVATRAVASLATLTSIGQVRYNHLLAAGLNLLFLWDLQAVLLLERWKRRYGAHAAQWFSVIGEVEMLSSLATLPFDHPDWCDPDLVEETHCFEASQLGHPLIDGAKRVSNDVHMGGAGSVMIITGSNMSGKTTLLRTIGINLVLAYSGAPACAASLRCAPEQLLTSMRISDDLQHGISTFYAELLRIRFILDALAKRSSIVLIDEIFRGTNTYDRYEAAVKVLEHLAGQAVMTVISTHDLDLADLEESGSANRFHNYHFEDHYYDNAIHFDYRLRVGRATTSNALRLLEMVGIVSASGKEE